MPTAANLKGDFSVMRRRARGCRQSTVIGPGSTHAPITLVDPLTGATLPGNKYAAQPTYATPSLALDAYLPTPTAALDPNNCGFVFYAILTN